MQARRRQFSLEAVMVGTTRSSDNGSQCHGVIEIDDPVTLNVALAWEAPGCQDYWFGCSLVPYCWLVRS